MALGIVGVEQPIVGRASRIALVGKNILPFEIYEQLKSEPRGPRRSALVDEAFRLQAAKLE